MHPYQEVAAAARRVAIALNHHDECECSKCDLLYGVHVEAHNAYVQEVLK